MPLFRNTAGSGRIASMAPFATRTVFAGIAVLLVLLLAGCSQPDAQAGKDGDRIILTTQAATADDADSANGDSHADQLRPPPPGTLRYTIVVTGNLHKTGQHRGEYRNATIHRKLEFSTFMQGTLGNGALDDAHPGRASDKPPANPAKQPRDDLDRQAEACDGNTTCIMKLMSDPATRKMVEEAGNQMLAMIGRTAVWSRRAPCKGHLTVDDRDDRAAWWEDIGEGYHKTGLDKRSTVARAEGEVECKPTLLVDDPEVAAHLIADGTRVWLDKQSGDYDITFGPSQIELTPMVNGKPGRPKKLGIPEIALTGFSGAAIGKPFRGSKTVDVESEDGVPLRAEIAWTFTPEKS